VAALARKRVVGRFALRSALPTRLARRRRSAVWQPTGRIRALPGHPTLYCSCRTRPLVAETTAKTPRRADSPEADLPAVRLMIRDRLEAGQFLIDATALSRTALGDYALYYKADRSSGSVAYTEANRALRCCRRVSRRATFKEALALRLAQLALRAR
jgi:hypothetical protein